jgi:hypothetical protein
MSNRGKTHQQQQACGRDHELGEREARLLAARQVLNRLVVRLALEAHLAEKRLDVRRRHVFASSLLQRAQHRAPGLQRLSLVLREVVGNNHVVAHGSLAAKRLLIAHQQPQELR